MFTRNRNERPAADPGHSTHSTLKRTGAFVTALGVGVSLALAGAAPATAATSAPSYALGQFFSGSLLGSDLAELIALSGAEAYNDGSQDKQVSQDPLNATVLDSLNLNVPGGVQLPVGNFIDAGAAGQYAEANSDGKSLAASGAVGSGGAIGAGVVTPGTHGDLDFDIDPVIDDEFDDILTDLQLSLDAVSAQAVGNLDQATGTYRIDGATLRLQTPLIADLVQRVETALVPLEGALDSLGGSSGELIGALTGVLDLVNNTLLELIGSEVTFTASVQTDVVAVVKSLLTTNYSNGAVNFDLESGLIEIDLEALHGGSLNNLPVNTELLTDVQINQILTGITSTLDGLIEEIMSTIDETLDQAVVDLHAFADIDVDAQELLSVVCPDSGAVQSLLDSLMTGIPLIDDLLGIADLSLGQLTGLLNDALDGVVGTVTSTFVDPVTGLLCANVSNIIPAVDVASVDIDVTGTLAQILNGVQGTASATITVAGVAVPVNISNLLNALDLAITDELFDLNGGAVSQVLSLLNTGLLNPAVSGLLGNGVSIEALLTDILSLRVNLQERWMVGGGGMAAPTGSYFTQTALRFSVLGGDLTTLNIAAATVGPNINQVIDPGCQVDCDPDGPDGPDGPGDPDTTATDRLATTGVGIATLIAVILALLAAGAYLAREGYRKNHPQPLS